MGKFGYVCKKELKVNMGDGMLKTETGCERMNVRLNRKQLEEVDCLGYLGSTVTVDRKAET